MVQALVELNQNVNRVLNMIKAKYELKDKGAAIEFVVNEYIEQLDEPDLRPEFIEEMRKAQKEKSIRVNDFAKRYGLK
ncbi:DUF2683 family protein [Candidatus Woesearchaeota archaeon]|jgi:hypothetical protein|nr:DUF2683 family protein [Candidatus Woesearchaeota archaeon]MBT6518845.1 DUF2683 family protein [Candidatus Woesearchaeota archaeon]MBT7367984.1 DUF2683 family protein [Candidatus Woesearchaeota archaeon]